MSFFKRLIPSGISLTSEHFLVLDMHKSHVTLEVIEMAQEFGLDMITLPSQHPMLFGLWMCFTSNLFKYFFKNKGIL